jgi:SAM-dependent methyltransferase
LADFNVYKDTYEDEVAKAISFAGQDHDFYTEIKAERLVQIASRHLGNPATLAALDVGCGVGETDSLLEKRFGSLNGVDVAEGPVKIAAASNPLVNYQVYDGEVLPFQDNLFDLSFAICVLHHVDTTARDSLIREMTRVTRTGGLVVLFEHNPFNPLTRRVVSRCKFDDDAELLRMSSAIKLLLHQGLSVSDRCYILLLPFGSRKSTRLERAFGRLPLGAQYYVAGTVA